MGGKPSAQDPRQNWLREALVGLVPEWRGQAAADISLEALGGASQCVFKASSGQGVYCVRKLRPQDLNLVAATRQLADAGLTPEVVAYADVSQAGCTGILVQRWLVGSSPKSFFWREPQGIEQLAHFVARFHSQPMDTQVEKEKARPEDLIKFIAILNEWMSPDMSARFLQEIDKLARTPRQRSQLVLTHGDLHHGNLLLGTEIGGSESKMWAIDMELVGPRPFETDLAYMFINMAISHAMKTYPSIASRRGFMQVYLASRGLAHDTSAVEDALFAIEKEYPFQAIFIACSSFYFVGDASHAHFVLSILPHVRRILAEAEGDVEIKRRVVEMGAASAAWTQSTVGT